MKRNGLYWEQFELDQVFVSGSRTITEADIVGFAGISGDWNPLHMDEEFARTTPFGRRIAHGLLGLTAASGLGDREGILTGTLIAFLGMEWNFKAPIFIGDTISQRRVVIEKRASREPGRGLLKFKVEIFNQKDEIVQEGTRTVLIQRESHGTSA